MKQGIFSEKLKNAPHDVAVIGAGASGSILATLLVNLGFKVTLIEKKQGIFQGLSSSMNNGAMVHHIMYGGDPKTQSKLFKSGVLFSELFPKHIFVADKMLFLAPHTTAKGEANTAVTGECTKTRSDISLKACAERLKNDYQTYCTNSNSQPFGKPDDIYHMVTEDELLNRLGTPPQGKTWLGDDPQTSQFKLGAMVHQRVLSNLAFGQHMESQLKKLETSGDLHLAMNSGVKEVTTSTDGGFDVHFDDASKSTQHFHNVVNAGYAEGEEIIMPAGSRNIGIGQKMFGIYKIPEGHEKEFETSLFMIRDFSLGSVIRLKGNYVALNAGVINDRGYVEIGGESSETKIPPHWFDGDAATATRKTSDDTSTEKDLLTDIRGLLAKWIPSVAMLEPVRLNRAPHMYPHGRDKTEKESTVVAARRDEANIVRHTENPRGGQTFGFYSGKLTGIPLGAVEAARKLLKPYIDQGILTQEEVDEQLTINEKTGYAHISDALKDAMGRNTPEPSHDALAKFVTARHPEMRIG